MATRPVPCARSCCTRGHTRVSAKGRRRSGGSCSSRPSKLRHEIAHHGYLYESLEGLELAVHGVEGAPSIVEMPVQGALDDWDQYRFLPGLSGEGLIESAAKVQGMWTLELEAVRAMGGCFTLTNHPFLTGRPSRAQALDRVIRLAAEDPEIRVASLQQIAEHTRALDLTPRNVSAPTLP